jgi:hypothetical protein
LRVEDKYTFTGTPDRCDGTLLLCNIINIFKQINEGLLISYALRAAQGQGELQLGQVIAKEKFYSMVLEASL